MRRVWMLFIVFLSAVSAAADPAPPLARPRPVSVADLSKSPGAGVEVREVSDYAFGGYAGEFPSPPCADGNPRKAFVVTWKDSPFRFVFSHEASYCPWFEAPDGSAVSFQFFEGNDGWAELFNQWGRLERNSFADVVEAGPKRAWVRWTYFGVNQESGQPAYRAVEDFWAYPNGLVLRRQAYRTLLPGDHRGYTREPIEMIGLCPVGRLWSDILERDPATGERHALAVLDPFSTNRQDVFWKPRAGTLWDCDRRRSGSDWKALDDAEGVVMVVPLAAGPVFCAFGDASGFGHGFTRIKEHSFPDTGGSNWGGASWDHWPIGWLNSQGHPVDEASLKRYPNHFSPAGMDVFALPDDASERGVYYSLYGVGRDMEAIRKVTRRWLEKGPAGVADPDSGADLPPTAAKFAPAP